MNDLLNRLREIVGDDYLSSESSFHKQIKKGTFKEQAHSSAILRPACRTELADILRQVKQYNHSTSNPVTVQALSSGKNWGYTSAEPSEDNAIIILLDRLDKIWGYDDKQGAVRVEPGVTQQQLYDYLKAQGDKYWIDSTGSSPECSIIGNSLERGFGHTPYGDHFDHICSLEVMLASGDIIDTGFRQFRKSMTPSVAENTYKWGVGPYLDGIFSQSNMGIVLSSAVLLMPKPEHFVAFFVSIDKEEQFPELIDALQPLKLKGTLKSSVHIGNDDKAIQAVSTYPFDLMENQTPLSEAVKKKLKKRYMAKSWAVSGAFYGTKAEIKIWVKELKRAVRPVKADVKIIDNRLMSWLDKLKGPLTRVSGIDFSANITLLKEVFYLKQGKPTYHFLKSILWRKKALPSGLVSELPSHDAGLLWVAPVAPIDGKHAQNLKDIAYQTLHEYGFEPAISMTLLTERCLECIISIIYDRSIPGEDDKALACHHKIVRILLANGYYPYRLSSPIQTKYEHYLESSTTESLRKIKKALDPDTIFAQKKYGV